MTLQLNIQHCLCRLFHSDIQQSNVNVQCSIHIFHSFPSSRLAGSRRAVSHQSVAAACALSPHHSHHHHHHHTPAHCTSAQKSCKSKPHTGQREEFHPEKRKQEEKSAMSKRKVWQMKHMHHMAAHTGSRPGRQEHITLIAHQASLTTTSSGGKRLGENQPKIDSTHTHNDFTPAPCSLNKCCMIAGVLLS